MTYREDLMADMTGLDIPAMHDVIDDRIVADRDFSPVPAEFRDMSWAEIVEILDEQAREEALWYAERELLPHRWN